MESSGRKRARVDLSKDGVIKALVPRGRDKERVLVRLTDSRSLELAEALVARESLAVGQRLTADEMEQLVAEDMPYRARARALRLLTARERCQGELEHRLLAEGYEGEVVRSTLEWLRQRAYVDDRRFAEQFVAEKVRAGWGLWRIRSGLLGKGVERSVVEAVLQECDLLWTNETGSDRKVDPVLALARRRFAAQFLSDPEGAARRLAGYLLRRGHDWETIAAVEATLRSEAQAGSGDGDSSES